MPLCRRPACHTVIFYKGSDIASGQFAFLYAKSSDHLIVCLRNITCSRRFCNIRILHLRRIFINIKNLKAGSLQRIRYQSSDYVLWSRSGSDRMTSDDISTNLRAYTVILAYHDRETCNGILQDRKAFLYMVFTIHAEFCCTSACCNDNMLESSCFYKSCCMQNRMSRTCTEAANVRTCCVGETCNLSGSLCKVSAASLVHITACFLAAVNHVINFFRSHASLLYQFDQRDHVGSLCHQVLKHYMSRKVHIYIMCTLNCTYQLIVHVQAFRVLVIYESGNRLRRALVLIKNSKLCLCEKILSRKFSLYFRGKAFFQIYEVKYIANLDDTIEFILRHNREAFGHFLS